MSKAKAPTSMLSQRLLRREGYFVEVTERYEVFCHVPERQKELLAEGRPITRKADLLGLGDILAFRPDGKGPLLVQVTTVSNRSAHRLKALGAVITQPKEIDPKQRIQSTLALWLRSGGRFELQSWSQPDGRLWSVARETALVAPEAPTDYTARTRLDGGLWLWFRETASPMRQARLAI